MFRQRQILLPWRRIVFGLIFAFMAGCAGHTMTHPTMMHPGSLYDRLGGKAAIEAVVDAFVSQLGADTRIQNENVKARFSKVHLPSLKAHLTNQICQGSGGPCKYTGRDMKSAHTGLEITKEEFGFVVEDLIIALDKFNVPQKEKEELLGLLGPMEKEIVQKH
jgi:hemoglobin